MSRRPESSAFFGTCEISELGSLRRTRTYRKEEASQRCGEGVSEENNEDILVCERACLANEEHGLKLLSGFQPLSFTARKDIT